MVRHGVSETNKMQEKGLLGWIMHFFKKDPSLVKEGVENSKKKGEWLSRIMMEKQKQKPANHEFSFIDSTSCNTLPDKFELVLTSELLRAIETSICMFEQKLIYVIPYVTELFGYQNTKPLSKKHQQNIIGLKYPKANVNWKYVGDTPSSPSFKKFKSFLKQVISKEIREKDEYNVCVVTHSLYMMKYVMSPNLSKCNWFWRWNVIKPKNNDIIRFQI
jgi:bisphosphoglycerate-dependent phosphoglycerate mutase